MHPCVDALAALAMTCRLHRAAVRALDADLVADCLYATRSAGARGTFLCRKYVDLCTSCAPGAMRSQRCSKRPRSRGRARAGTAG